MGQRLAIAASTRSRLVLALALPSLVAGVGTFGARSLPITFALYLFGACLIFPWIVLRRGRAAWSSAGLPLTWRGPRPWPRAAVWLTVAFGPVFLAVYAVVRPHLGAVADYRERVAALGFPLETPWLALAIFLVANPLIEEWWWRGQATPRCCAAFGPARGLALVTAGFGLYHLVLLAGLFSWPVALVRSLLIAAAGLIWSWLAVRQHSWRDAYLAHLAADAAMVILFVVMILP